MYSSNLCPLQSVLQNGKNAKFAKLTSSNLCCLHHYIFLQLLNVKLNENIYCLLASLTTFCDKIRARTQRTNYICNTDPSNPALSKAQISNNHAVSKICTKDLHQKPWHKKFSHPFLSLCYPIVLFFHSFMIKFAAFCV